MNKRARVPVAVAAMIVVLVLAAIGEDRFGRSSTNVSPLQPPPGKASISGMLIGLGGTVGNSPTPLSGEVDIANVRQIGPIYTPVAIGSDGTFTIDVSPGLYQLTGKSSMYPIRNFPGVCRAAHTPVHVSAGDSVVVNVFCRER